MIWWWLNAIQSTLISRRSRGDPRLSSIHLAKTGYHEGPQKLRGTLVRVPLTLPRTKGGYRVHLDRVLAIIGSFAATEKARWAPQLPHRCFQGSGTPAERRMLSALAIQRPNDVHATEKNVHVPPDLHMQGQGQGHRH